MLFWNDVALFVDETETVSMRMVGGETSLSREEVQQLYDALHHWLIRRMVEDALNERLADDGR